MKKINNIFLILMVLTVFSCTDAIQINQPGRLSADAAFTDVSDLNLGLLSAYNELDITDMIEFASTFTDEISIGFDSGGQGVGDGRYLFILNSTSAAPADVWTDYYDAINSSTRIIEAAKMITPESGEEDLYNGILGQAYAIRAFSHFTLFTYFSTSYTDDSAPCVIAVDFIPTIDQELGRNTVGEVVGLINSDLNTADGLLSDDTSDPTFINIDFITALRARLEAYRGNYTAAAGFAKTLTDKYPLADKLQYTNMYDDNDNTEVIFKLERSINDSYDNQGTTGGGWAGALYAFVDATITGSPYFEMSRSLFNLLDPNDVRFSRNVAPTSVISADYQNATSDEDILVIQKYPGSDGQPLMNDLKVFRSSEMLFIEAEAAADAGNFSAAADLINELRAARIGSSATPLSFSSEQEAFAGILNERRIELCFEGHRYLDLKRLGARAGVTVDRDPVDCEQYGACNISIDDHRWTLPIPTVELNANSVIREQQNPGY